MSLTQKHIKVYFRPFCGFCAAVERLLTEKGYAFDKINIWEQPGAKQDMIAKSGGQMTVPQVFADGDYIGDCSALHDLEAAGQLDALLEQGSGLPSSV